MRKALVGFSWGWCGSRSLLCRPGLVACNSGRTETGSACGQALAQGALEDADGTRFLLD